MNKLIVSNQKIYFKNRKEFREYAEALISEMKNMNSNKVKICVLPDFLNVHQASDIFKDTGIYFGAQDVFWEDAGPYTGAISPLVLKDLGCTYIFIGHSERRKYFNENDQILNKKVHACCRAGLIPIVLIGETEEERNFGLTELIIEKQIRVILNGLPYDFIKKIVMMYEPVWAIGKADAATPEIIENSHKFIRDTMSKIYDKDLGENIMVIYGGSANLSNSEEILKIKGVDGLAATRGSLNAHDFAEIA
ncbi:MAG: triose-phosphate isomerase, partial [Actinomycetota bacterium]|nr:triose-phosphate isomerase [Actinomycetota bacterium]